MSHEMALLRQIKELEPTSNKRKRLYKTGRSDLGGCILLLVPWQPDHLPTEQPRNPRQTSLCCLFACLRACLRACSCPPPPPPPPRTLTRHIGGRGGAWKAELTPVFVAFGEVI